MPICLKPKRGSAPAKWCICRLARKKSIGRRHTVVKSDHSKDYDVILLLNTDVFTLCSLVRFSFFSLNCWLSSGSTEHKTTIIRTKIDHYSNVPKYSKTKAWQLTNHFLIKDKIHEILSTFSVPLARDRKSKNRIQWKAMGECVT